MEYSRRRGDGELHSVELMSSNDRVKNWHLSEKIRDNNYVNRPDKEKPKDDCSPEIPKLNLQTKVKERQKGSKVRKRDNVNSNVKTISKPQTARDASETRPEVKRFRKPSDRMRRPTLATCWKNVGNMETVEGPDTTTPWARAESSEEVMVVVNPVRSSPRKGKKKNEEKASKTPRQTEKENRKESEKKVPARKQKTKKTGEDKHHHVPLAEFSKVGSKTESAGKAVVIYQRENRRKCLNPELRDEFQYEQISFAGSYDLVQSKRSFSEPRHNSRNSLKEFFVARRRTRFDMEPAKSPPTHSDVQSTANSLNEFRASSEYQKFSDVENCVLQCYKTSTEDVEGLKGFQVVKQWTGGSSSQKTPTDKEVVATRLKETAKKKLNLHREMIRAEKKNKKKFWESIQRSLNYRCALAEMFSSTQSFASKDESSWMVSSCDASTGRSNCQGIFVQENVIEKISSYQSSQIPDNSKTKTGKKPKEKNHSSPPSQIATYRVSRDMTQPLLKPDENFEEKIIAKHDLEDVTWELISQSTFAPTENTFNVSSSTIWGTTSGKRDQLENGLNANRNPSSELESLMAKLSREIRRCSYFIKELNSSEQTDKDKPKDCLSFKVSASDSKLEVSKDYESRKDIFSGECTNTIMVYRIAESVQKKSKMKHCKAGSKKELDNSVEVKYSRKKESKGRKREKGILNSEPILKRIASNGTYYSSRVSSSTSSSVTLRRTAKDNNRDIICCDYCRFLKKRIFKLEKDLERIEKILPFYPVEYQDSLKNCLERLKTASDIVLKRLNSCAKSRHEEHQKEENKVMMTGDVKRPKSAPLTDGQSLTVVKSFLRSSNSENEVSRGTKSVGVTTEPMSEVTEDKAAPKDKVIAMKEQQTSFIVDANCTSTSLTGPTVKTFSDTASSNPFLDLVFPVAGVKEPSPELLETPTQTDGNSPMAVGKDDSCSSIKKENTSLGQEQSFQEDSKYVKQPEECQSLSSHQSETNDLVKTESAKSKDKETEVNSGSREFVTIENGKAEMKELKTSEKKERPRWSRIPTRRKTTFNVSLKLPDSVFVKSNWRSSSKSDGNSMQRRAKVISGHSPRMLAKLFSFTWTFGFFLCKLVHYMQSVSAICSVLTLTAMSLERYYAIVHPMKAQYICTISQARRIITGTWISAFLLAVPILFAQVHLRVGVKVEAYWCVRDWDNKAIWRAHELYMMLLILVVPTGVMAVAYTAICWEIWEVIQRRQDMTAGKGHGSCRKPRVTRSSSSESFPAAAYTNNNTRMNGRKRGRGVLKREDDGASVKQVIKMLVAVVIIYVLCWGPMLIDNVLQAYGILNHIRMGWLKYMGTAFHLMAYFNSCINPIIYGFMSKNFRESFMKALCCGGRKPKTALRNFSLSQTRNTSIRYAESSFGRSVSIALPV